MRPIHKIHAFLIATVFVLLGLFMVFKINQSTEHFKDEQNKIVSLLNFNERLLDVKEAIPLYGDWVWNAKYLAYQVELDKSREAYYDGLKLSYWLVLVATLLLMVLVLVFYKRDPWFGLSYGLLCGAFLFLLAGLFTPLLEIEAYKENLEIKLEVDAAEMLKDFKSMAGNIPFVGGNLSEYIQDILPGFEGESYKWHKVYPDKMYFFYENKGLFDVLSVLWNSGNIPMALIVGLFSFLVPAVKLIFSFTLLFLPVRRLKKWRNAVNFLSKFSMLDVMVVSLFVTFFTFDHLSTGIDTSSKLLIGTYFFTSYVMLALISGVTIEKYLNKRMTLKEELKK